MKTTMNESDLMVASLLRFIEEETAIETDKIIEKYKSKIHTEMEDARARIVAQAGVRLSEIMSIQDLGRTIRIEITKYDPTR